MAGPPPYRGSDGNLYHTPRWVKVFGIIALVVVLLFVILMFTGGPGGRGHGPGRHMLSSDAGGRIPLSRDTTLSRVTEDHTPSDHNPGDHKRPAGGRG